MKTACVRNRGVARLLGLAGSLGVIGLFGAAPANAGDDFSFSIGIGAVYSPPVVERVVVREYVEPVSYHCYAGTLTIDGRDFQIETDRNIASQMVEAFRCMGYWASSDGWNVRVNRSLSGPKICWRAGDYCLDISKDIDQICLKPAARSTTWIVDYDWSWDWDHGCYRDTTYRYRYCSTWWEPRYHRGYSIFFHIGNDHHHHGHHGHGHHGHGHHGHRDRHDRHDWRDDRHDRDRDRHDRDDRRDRDRDDDRGGRDRFDGGRDNDRGNNNDRGNGLDNRLGGSRRDDNNNNNNNNGGGTVREPNGSHRYSSGLNANPRPVQRVENDARPGGRGSRGTIIGNGGKTGPESTGGRDSRSAGARSMNPNGRDFGPQATVQSSDDGRKSKSSNARSGGERKGGGNKEGGKSGGGKGGRERSKK